MINSSNISDYISFLYAKKYNGPAPVELLERWKQVPDSEIRVQLDNLYRYWNLSADEAQGLEGLFLSQVAPTPAAKYSDNKDINPLIAILLGGAVILIGLIMLLSASSKQSSEDDTEPINASVLNTSPSEDYREQLEQEIVSLKKEIEAIKSSSNSQELATSNSAQVLDEEVARRKIEEFIHAEERQNLDDIMSHFSDRVLRYWDMTNPSKEVLRNKYRSIWDKIDFPSHNNYSINKNRIRFMI